MVRSNEWEKHFRTIKKHSAKFFYLAPTKNCNRVTEPDSYSFQETKANVNLCDHWNYPGARVTAVPHSPTRVFPLYCIHSCPKVSVMRMCSRLHHMHSGRGKFVSLKETDCQQAARNGRIPHEMAKKY